MVRPPKIAPRVLPLSPVEAAARCLDQPGLVFFDTALLPERREQQAWGHEAHSLLACRPAEILSGHTPEDWERLRHAVAARQVENDAPFPTGFAAGWIAYDGSFSFGFYDDLLAFSHDTREWYGVGSPLLPDPSAPLPEHPTGPLRFTPSMSRQEYIDRVRAIQRYIAAGDIYQVNLTHRLLAPRLPGSTSPFALYAALRHASPAPYAAYLHIREAEHAILSSSPELFLQISGRRVRTRPIKGTRPRGTDPATDEALARDLLASPKENAELLMITDLERNDLGRICGYGTVNVTGMLELEAYRHIFHLVSTVEGELRPEVDAVTALRACFPGGSITGAPKKRAMEIIHELEAPVPRGLYTGALGYFGYNGRSCFNIAIRTVIFEKEQAHFHVGAGIVADSDPASEWQETLDKAAGILQAAGRPRPLTDFFP